MTEHRRRFKQTKSLEERLAAEAIRLRQDAEDAPPDIEREQLLRKARQAATGSHLSEWLRSPGLRASEQGHALNSALSIAGQKN